MGGTSCCGSRCDTVEELFTAPAGHRPASALTVDRSEALQRSASPPARSETLITRSADDTVELISSIPFNPLIVGAGILTLRQIFMC